MGASDTQHENDNVTNLLVRLGLGDQADEGELIELVYPVLHEIAQRYLRDERPDHSLQPTALVNEAYVRLIEQRRKADTPKPLANREHFFAISAIVMRQILVDHARARRASKRGGGKRPVSLDGQTDQILPAGGISVRECEDLIALDEALTDLAAILPRRAAVIEMRLFAGMSRKDIGRRLDISERSVDRELAAALSWLTARLTTLR